MSIINSELCTIIEIKFKKVSKVIIPEDSLSQRENNKLCFELEKNMAEVLEVSTSSKLKTSGLKKANLVPVLTKEDGILKN